MKAEEYLEKYTIKEFDDAESWNFKYIHIDIALEAVRLARKEATEKQKYDELPNADFNIVDFTDPTPHCNLHGAMNKMTADGIWRCVSTYKEWWEGGNRKFDENNCKAGCQEVVSEL